MSGIKIKISDFKEKATALLIFIPSIVFVPHILYIIFLYQLKNFKINSKIDTNYFIIFLIIVLSILNQIFVGSQGNNVSQSISSLIPYSFFIFISFLLAKNISKKLLKFLLFLILLEILIGFLEYISGTHSFFITSKGQSPFGVNGYLYYSRVFGLSENSSTLAFKIFMGVLILNHVYPIKQYKTTNLIILSVLLTGIFISFNRTIIISTIIFYSLLYRKALIKILFRPFTLIIVVAAIIVVFNLYFESIFTQFSRGKDVEESAGRLFIWLDYIEFIKSNLFFGNGSVKRWIILEGNVRHAHNSFLQTLATNGIFIFSLYMFYIFRNINKKNFIYIVPCLFASISQYFLLWGISLWDIIFYYFLLNKEFHLNNE